MRICLKNTLPLLFIAFTSLFSYAQNFSVSGKILNFKTNEIRKDNFDRLIGIKKKQLVLESKLYNIEEAKPNYYIMKQKRSYSEARFFNILLKTNENEIIDFIVFNDFSISDLKFDSTSLIVLLSNLNQTNEYWKSKQQIQIIKLDSNFNKIWNFIRESNYPPLNGQDITIGKNEYSFKIEVITGCHICYVISKLALTKNGQFKSIRSIEKHNSEDISEKILFDIFAKP